LFEKVKFTDVWECACGEGVMSDAIAEHGVLSFSSDKYDYGYGEVLDFLSYTGVWHGDIVTNPPFCLCIDFIDKGYSLLEEGRHLALFLPLRYLEGCQRKKCFERCPLKAVFVSVGRLGCFNNGNCANSCRSAICYAWFLWEKGYSGSIVLDWL
jgi:hypothetical protein